MAHARNDRGTDDAAPSSRAARSAARRARRAPQAPAGALVPAAHGHAAPRRARRVAAGARLRRRSSWRSSPRCASRRPRATPGTRRSPSTRPRTTSPSPSWSRRCCSRGRASTATAPSARGCRASSPRCSRSRWWWLLYGDRQRPALLQLLHLLRLAVLRRRLRRRRSASPTSAPPGGCCARPATSAGRCSSAPASTSRTWPTRCAPAAATTINVIGFVSLLAAARQRAASRSGTLEDIGDIVVAHRVDEVIIADPDFPEREAVELVDQCHQRGVARAHRALDDGDPRPPRRVRAGPVGPALRAQAAGLRGLRLRAQAHLRPRRLDAASWCCSARCCWRARWRSSSPRAGR